MVNNFMLVFNTFTYTHHKCCVYLCIVKQVSLLQACHNKAIMAEG